MVRHSVPMKSSSLPKVRQVVPAPQNLSPRTGLKKGKKKEQLSKDFPEESDTDMEEPALSFLELEEEIPSLADSLHLEPEEDLSSSNPEEPLAPDSLGLAKSDPLTRYMHEIRKYPLLTREEEHRLAIRFAKTRSPDLAKQLITSNLRLVVKIAHEYRRAYRHLLDLIQEGNLGLLQAVEKYDPHRGVKLSSYAAWWIRAYMLKFILNNWRLVKIGTTQAQRKLFFNLNKEKDILEGAGFTASNQILASRLSVSEREVSDMQLRLSAGELSLDAPMKKDEEAGRSPGDMLEANPADRPDIVLEGQEFRTLLKEKLECFEKTLKGREQTLFRERLIAEQPLTLQEVGDRYQISRERARQVEARLLSRLKIYLKRELGDAVQVAMGLEG